MEVSCGHIQEDGAVEGARAHGKAQAVGAVGSGAPGLRSNPSAVGEGEWKTEAGSAGMREENACAAHADGAEKPSELLGDVRAARPEQLGAEEQRDRLVHELAGGPERAGVLPGAAGPPRAVEAQSRSVRLGGGIRETLTSLVDSCAKDAEHLRTLRSIVDRDRCEYNALASHLQTFQRMLEAAQARMREPVANLSRMLEEVEDSYGDVDAKSEGNGLRRELQLMQEMEGDRAALVLCREEFAGEEAQFASKAARLQDQLKRSQESYAETEEQLSTTRQNLTEHSGRHSQQVQQLNSELGASWTAGDMTEEECEALRQRLAQQQAQQTKAMDALHTQLFGAIESKRIADARLDEFKREMKIAEARYKEELLRLEQATAQSQTSPPESTFEVCSEVTATNTVIDELRNHLRVATEERNLLQHTLEWKAVDFESKIEEMDRQCKATNMQTQKQYESKVQDMQEGHKSELEKLQKKLELVKAAANASGTNGHPWQDGRWELRTKVVQPQPRGFFFPCPGRRPASEPVAAADPGMPGLGGLHFCQEICWRVVSSISDTVSLLCRPHGLVIQQASKAASTFWTSDMLIGRSVLNLLCDVTRAPWLRKAISTNQSLVEQNADTATSIPGFAMHQIGNEIFKTHDSQSVRFRILCIHFPQDPQKSRSVAVLIILEAAQREQDARWANGRGGGRKKPPSVHLRSSRSVASEDIKPGDSVSNVGMF